MAFHESHERECPACGARISATAPKCLNCGRFVDEDEEEDTDAPATSGDLLVIVLVAGGVLVAGAIVAMMLFG